jgi:hypothetical protein
MELAFQTLGVVIVVTILLAIVGYLIDRSAAHHQPGEEEGR